MSEGEFKKQIETTEKTSLVMISDLTIKKHIDKLENYLDKLLKAHGYNEYAVLYYQGKIDALKSLLKNGKKMCELDESFGL